MKLTALFALTTLTLGQFKSLNGQNGGMSKEDYGRMLVSMKKPKRRRRR